MYGPFMESVRAKFLTALVMTLALALPLASCGRTETDGMGSGGVGGVTGGVSTGGRSTGGAGMISGGAVGTGGGEGRIVCLANQHVQANACVACGVGTTNASGDDARVPTRAATMRARRLSLSGDTLAVGASGESSAAVGVNGDLRSNAALQSGAVFVRRIAPRAGKIFHSLT